MCDCCDRPNFAVRRIVHIPGLWDGPLTVCWECSGYATEADFRDDFDCPVSDSDPALSISCTPTTQQYGER